jgi:hypothetical protein
VVNPQTTATNGHHGQKPDYEKEDPEQPEDGTEYRSTDGSLLCFGVIMTEDLSCHGLQVLCSFAFAIDLYCLFAFAVGLCPPAPEDFHGEIQ